MIHNRAGAAISVQCCAWIDYVDFPAEIVVRVALEKIEKNVKKLLLRMKFNNIYLIVN